MKKSIVVISSILALSLVLGGGLILSQPQETKKVEATSSSYWASGVSQSSINAGGETLMTALKNKISSNVSTLSYSALWTAYKTTDIVPGTTTKIWDMYGGFQFTYGTDQAGSYSKEGDVYNREHSIPKSWFNDATPMYTDLVHLIPTDGKVNGMRSNYALGEVNSASYTYSFPARNDGNGNQIQSAGASKLGNPKAINSVSCGATKVFEPDDQYKGDLARIYMYFATRYGSVAASDDGTYNFSNSFPYLSSYGLAMIKKWHVQDPVSQKELDRNDGIEEKQGNRNPYVDHPEWGDKVFGTNYEETHGSGSGEQDTPTLNITASNTSMEVGGSVTLTANVTNMTGTVNWYVADYSSDVITLSSTSGSSITVNGVSTGTKTVYAYLGAVSDSVDITVTSSGEGGGEDTPVGGDETVVFADEGYSNGAEVTTVSLNNSTITFAKNTGSNPPKYYTSGSAVRCYPNNTITVSSSKNIVKIVLTYGTGGDNNTITTNVTSFDGNATWTGKSKSVTFTIGGSSGNRRIASITVTYEGSSDEPTLSGITLDTTNVKKTFTVGDTFTYSGLKVTANYSDSSSEVVASGYTVSTPDMSTSGTKTITVTYNGKTATYNITVNPKSVASITASVNKTYYVGETISASDITVKDSNNETVTDFTFASDNYQFTYSDATSGGALTNKTFTNSITSNGLTCSLDVQVQRKARVDALEVTDTLTRETTGIADGSSSYTDWSNKTGTSGAVYAGQSAGTNNSIQIRSKNSDSGVVSTTSGGTLASVTVAFASQTQSGRTLNIYGKNSAYSSASDLYNSSNQGTLLGTIVCGSSTMLSITGSYNYIGICSADGAIYLSKIEIAYGGGDDAKNVANFIMYEDTDGQCNTKFATAEGYFEGLAKAERATFMTSSDYVIATARERLNAWADHLGKTISYVNGDYEISPTREANMFVGLNDKHAVIVITSLSIASLAAVGAYLLIKKRKIEH